MDRPLATRMRPRNFKEFVGHHHLLGEGKPLTKLIEVGTSPPSILWGPRDREDHPRPPARRCAVGADFQQLSAVSSGVSDARRVMDHSKTSSSERSCSWTRCIAGTRRNRSPPAGDRGRLGDLIGATTENPYHSLVSPLISRCLLLRLEPSKPRRSEVSLELAVVDAERGMGTLGVSLTADALDHLVECRRGCPCRAHRAGGRRPPRRRGRDRDRRSARGRRRPEGIVAYDRGDNHFDVVSAFIKSMRGSDPDATLFWLGRMIHAGEDPRFIVAADGRSSPPRTSGWPTLARCRSPWRPHTRSSTSACRRRVSTSRRRRCISRGPRSRTR